MSFRDDLAEVKRKRDEYVERVAKAMEAKRAELIAQPLSRVWGDLAKAAIKAMREPTEAMLVAGGENNSTGDYPQPSVSWPAMIDAAMKDML